MTETFRHQKLLAVFLGQLFNNPLSIAGGADANIRHNVKMCTSGVANQLSLGVRGCLIMEPRSVLGRAE